MCFNFLTLLYKSPCTEWYKSLYIECFQNRLILSEPSYWTLLESRSVSFNMRREASSYHFHPKRICFQHSFYTYSTASIEIVWLPAETENTRNETTGCIWTNASTVHTTSQTGELSSLFIGPICYFHLEKYEKSRKCRSNSGPKIGSG